MDNSDMKKLNYLLDLPEFEVGETIVLKGSVVVYVDKVINRDLIPAFILAGDHPDRSSSYFYDLLFHDTVTEETYILGCVPLYSIVKAIKNGYFKMGYPPYEKWPPNKPSKS